MKRHIQKLKIVKLRISTKVVPKLKELPQGERLKKCNWKKERGEKTESPYVNWLIRWKEHTATPKYWQEKGDLKGKWEHWMLKRLTAGDDMSTLPKKSLTPGYDICRPFNFWESVPIFVASRTTRQRKIQSSIIPYIPSPFPPPHLLHQPPYLLLAVLPNRLGLHRVRLHLPCESTNLAYNTCVSSFSLTVTLETPINGN